MAITMRMDNQRLAALAGWLGVLIMALCCTLPACVYPEKHGAGFSFLNHFMSELGIYRSSPWAVVFNCGLFIGGGLLVASMLGVGLQYPTRLGRAATLCGILSGTACALLGFFPLNKLAVHLCLAYTFFCGWPVTVLLFCVLLGRQPRNQFTRPLLLLGGLSFLLFVIFLSLPFVHGLQRLWTLDLRHYERPAFLFPALLEWLMVLSVLAWIALACTAQLRRQPASPAG